MKKAETSMPQPYKLIDFQGFFIIYMRDSGN